MILRTLSLALPAAVCSLVLIVPCTARAVAPDFEGERGLEGGASFGYGTYANTTQRLFWRPVDASTPNPPAALWGGANLRVHAGYRVVPYLSVGAFGELQWIGTAPLGAAPTVGLSGGGGLYVRFYPAALINQTLEVRRVRFGSLLDRRRFDPFVSLGVEYHALGRTQNPDSTTSTATWTRTAVGLPLAAGLEFRPVPALAVGVQLGASLLFGGDIDETARGHDASGNPVVSNTHYVSVDALNAAFFAALSARYTFTF